MTPPEQNRTLNLNLVWNKGQGNLSCPPDMNNAVIGRMIVAVDFCNAFESRSLEDKVSMMTLWAEGKYEQAVREGDCTLKDIPAEGITLGIICRYADTVIEPLDL
jgi:hypothetical protein